MPLTGSRTVALSVSALALALLPCTRTSHTQAVWHLHLHPAPHPCTVSPGAPPAPAPSPAQHTPHRQRHSLDVELGEDDVGDRCRRGSLAPIGEGDAHLREEALDGRRARRAAEILARHHREVGELLGVLLPPVERVPLRLV